MAKKKAKKGTKLHIPGYGYADSENLSKEAIAALKKWNPKSEYVPHTSKQPSKKEDTASD